MPMEPIDLAGAYRVLNPGSVVLVSVGDESGDNLLAITWNMPVRKDPPMAALLVGKRHHSYPFIARTGELGVNVLDASRVAAVYGCGTVSGAEEADKWARAGLTRRPGERIGAPLVEEAVAALECRVCQVVDLGATALLVANVLAGFADPEHCPGGEWRFDRGLGLLHHLGGARFTASDRLVEP